jgi:hypothetical protein
MQFNNLTASTASFLIDCQFYLALNALLDSLGVFNLEKVIMPMDLMQKYDWSSVKASLIYSIPDYCRVDDPTASGIVMLNKLIKSSQYETFLNSIVEYQVSLLQE